MRLAESVAEEQARAPDRRPAGAVIDTTTATIAAGAIPPRSLALLGLQRSAGNAAVAQLVTARTTEPRHRRPSLTISESRTATPVVGGPAAGERSPATDAAAAPPTEVPAAGDEFISVREPGEGSDGQATEEGGDQEGVTPEVPAQDEAATITADAAQSEEQVLGIAAERRGEVTRQFSGARARVTSMLGGTSTAIQAFLGARQAELQAASASVLGAGQAALTSTAQSARTGLEQARAVLQGVGDAATAKLAGQVTQAAGRITGLVDGLPLPDLPGVSTIRSGLRSLAGRAARVVTAQLGSVRSMIAAGLQQGTQLLGSLVTSAVGAAGSALSGLASAVQRATSAVASTLSRVAATAVGGLRTAVTTAVLPALGRAESAVVANLATAAQQAVQAIRENSARHAPASAGPGADADSGSAEDVRATNAAIVDTFRSRTGAILGSVFGGVAGAAAALSDRFGQVVSRITGAIAAPIAQVMAKISEAGAALGGFLQALLGDVTGRITQVVQSVRTAVDAPVDAVLQLAVGVAERAGRVFSGIGRRLLGGSFGLPDVSELIGDARAYGGPITKPKPGPITLPSLQVIAIILAAFGAITLYFVPQLAVAVVAVLGWLGITVGPAVLLVIVGAVALALVAVLLLLLYLLYRALKTKPSPKPVRITHKTVFATPDGSPKTRKDVGVGEQVVITGSASGRWTVTGGRPTTASGKKFTWTAPNRAQGVTITLRVGTATATEQLEVVEPASITAVRNSTIPIGKGTAGAGMKLSFHYLPKTVSFGNALAKEVSGPATNITGYYRKHYTDADLHHDSGDTFFPVRENNVDSAEDTASTRDTITPYEAGSFDWVIPNHFKVKTERGDGKKFTEVTQAFAMLDATGRVRIDKAGAQVERSPGDP